MKIKATLQKNNGVVEKQTNKKCSEKSYVQAIARVLACGQNHKNSSTAQKSNLVNGAKLKEGLVACCKKRGRHKKEQPLAKGPGRGVGVQIKKKDKGVKGKVTGEKKGKNNASTPSRTHRMASLNALAKVHILYENESRLGPNEIVENSITMPEDKPKVVSLCKAIVPIKKEPKEHVSIPRKEAKPSKERTKKVELPVPPTKKRRNRKHPSDVEIIDTRVCRRLASLNAQAILAASYRIEKSRRDKRDDDKVCFGDGIVTYDRKISSITTQTTCTYFQKQAQGKQGQYSVAGGNAGVRQEPRIKEKASNETAVEKQPQGTRTMSKVGMTHYTEVTQVHMTKEMAVKEEVKSKRTIERILEKDDVAITRMYRYQSKDKSESYCLQMHTTYQPPTTPTDFSPPDSPRSDSGTQVGKQPPQPQCVVNNVVQHPGQGNSYYGYSPPVVPGGQNFAVGTQQPVSTIPVVSSMARHYGSAFTVPHYGPPSAVSYPPGSDYGYYQPPSNVVQPVHEQCMIHKPVPYHPQHIHSPPPPAHHPHHHHHHHRSSPHLPPPPAHNPFPQDQCIPHHQMEHGYPQQPYPPQERSYAPVSPYHCQSPNVQRCMYSPQSGSYHSGYQVMAPMPAGPKGQPSPSPHQINAVPKTEPTTPPELKPNGYGSIFATYPGLPSDLPPLIREDCSPPGSKCPELCEECQRQSVVGPEEGTPTAPKTSLRSKTSARQKESSATPDSGSGEASHKGRSPSSGRQECSQLACKLGRRSSGGSAKKAQLTAPPPSKKIRKSLSPEVEVAPAEPPVQVPRPGLGVSGKKKAIKRFSNGWSWEGEPYDKLVFLCNDDVPCLRKCYPAMRHVEGDTINIRDCVLLRSGPRKMDLPFVAKVTALWETPEEGEMMMSLLWYYRPEHTEQGRRPQDVEPEIFASKHRDVNSVACIEDKCYVLTFSEYCRYKANMKMLEENVRSRTWVVPEQDDSYPRRYRMPPGRVSLEMVFFCRRVYDFRQKRILKNPT